MSPIGSVALQIPYSQLGVRVIVDFVDSRAVLRLGMHAGVQPLDLNASRYSLLAREKKLGATFLTIFVRTLCKFPRIFIPACTTLC